jgi:2'-5' RNA ligase
MSTLLALDVAVLPPTEVAERAIELSATLPVEESHDLKLDAEHLPHITLIQLFVREEELDTAFASIDDVLRDRPPLRLLVSGAAGAGTLSLTIEKAPELVELHETLMESLRGIERPGGTPAAFFGGDARAADALWVASYRLKSSFGHFAPHITLGHGPQPPHVEPFAFDASTIAACHLGRFCTCRKVLRAWALGPPSSHRS